VIHLVGQGFCDEVFRVFARSHPRGGARARGHERHDRVHGEPGTRRGSGAL